MITLSDSIKTAAKIAQDIDPSRSDPESPEWLFTHTLEETLSSFVKAFKGLEVVQVTYTRDRLGERFRFYFDEGGFAHIDAPVLYLESRARI